MALAVLLGCLVPFVRLGTAFTPDEGAYGLQVRALETGSWAYRYPAERYDPDGRYFPIVNSIHSERGWFPYVRHPLYPVMLWVSVEAFGEMAGLHLLSLVGTVGTAVAAWLVASELDRRSARLAFWVAAFGPVLVNGFVIWAHALSAAVSGLAVWAALRTVKGIRVTVGLAFAAASLVALGGMLRSEGLLFGASLGVVLAVAGVLRRRRASLVVGAACLVGVCVAGVTDLVWRRAIVGIPVGESLRAAGDSWLDRLEGARALLVGAHYADAEAGRWVALALAAVLAAAFLLRRSPEAHPMVLGVIVMVAVGAWVAKLRVGAADPVTGILPAWPAMMVGVGLLRREGTSPLQGMVAVAMALFAVAVVASQYAEAGGLEWGGRFLSPAAAPFAALAASWWCAWPWEAGRIARTAAGAGLAVILVVPAILGVISVRESRRAVASVVASVTAPRSDVIVSIQPHLPRAAWRTDDVVWMVPPQRERPEVLLRRLAGHAVPSVTVYGNDDVDPRVTGYRSFTTSARGAPEGTWRVIVLRDPVRGGSTAR